MNYSCAAPIHVRGNAARCRPENRRGAARATPRSVSIAFAIRVPSGHGAHVTDRPFVRLKVLAVQNAAALRYQTW